MAAEALKSAGARLERKQILAHLRRARRLYEAIQPLGGVESARREAVLTELDSQIAWVLSRRKRYEKRKGGLGRR